MDRVEARPLSAVDPPRPHTRRQIVFDQATALLEAQGMPSEPAMRLLEALAADALQGPFTSPRRFSAINADGFPFQWSVSLGNHADGLRFVTDCGRPLSSISERIRLTRMTLDAISPALGLARALPALDLALEALLPERRLLDASLMGLCLGVDVTAAGSVRIKVYVNGELGTLEARYNRFTRCLSLFGRRTAATRLDRFRQRLGTDIIPAFIAVDLVPEGIGRLKLYFRPVDGRVDILSTAAEALSGGMASQLDPLHRAFLDGTSYPERAVDFSLEAPPEGEPIGFKLDVNARRLCLGDADMDRRVLGLLEVLNLDDRLYRLTRRLVVGVPSTSGAHAILFAGLAVRGDERRVNVYFHPCPTPSP